MCLAILTAASPPLLPASSRQPVASTARLLLSPRRLFAAALRVSSQHVVSFFSPSSLLCPSSIQPGVFQTGVSSAQPGVSPARVPLASPASLQHVVFSSQRVVSSACRLFSPSSLQSVVSSALRDTMIEAHDARSRRGRGEGWRERCAALSILSERVPEVRKIATTRAT